MDTIVFALADAPLLTDFSLSSVVILLVNLAMFAAVGTIAWSLRRLISENDAEHKSQDAKIGKLTDAIAAEREARHDDVGQVSDRLWTVNTELKENYQPRREQLRLHGTLLQQIDRNHREVMARISQLPCTKPECPGEQT